MASAVPSEQFNPASNLEQNRLYQVGPRFWNIRGRFKMFAGLIDIQTQMSFVQLKNGKFLAIDTVELDENLRNEIDQLTDHGKKLEAVIATHPFHTLAFPGFFAVYPNAKYYGTPRHLRRLTEIPWTGDLNDCQTRKIWEPEIFMRIPAGAEFVNPQPESWNHFVSVFVYHPESKSLHVDDTIMYAEKPNFLLRLFGYKNGAMAFHPSIKGPGLYPTAEAPYLFRDWMKQLLKDWPFENICCAHLAIKIGGANNDVAALLNNASSLFDKLSEKNRKKKSTNEFHDGNQTNMNIRGDECG